MARAFQCDRCTRLMIGAPNVCPDPSNRNKAIEICNFCWGEFRDWMTALAPYQKLYEERQADLVQHSADDAPATPSKEDHQLEDRPADTREQEPVTPPPA